jgi:hypothetical protein
LICDPDRCDPDVLTDVALVAEGGETIPSTIDAHLTDVWPWLRIVPDAPLSPSTRYQIWGRLSRMACASDCVHPAREVVATFETGTRMDTAAPAFDGLGHIAEAGYSGASESECGHFSGIGFSLHWADAIDEGATGYRVEADGASVGMALPGQPPPSGFVACDGSPDVSFGAPANRGPYHVVALDLAGNEDDNTVTMSVSSECFPIPTRDADAGTSPDAGDAALTDAAPIPSDAGDAAHSSATDAGDAAGATPRDAGDAAGATPTPGGCSIGGAPTYGPAFWIVLVAARMRRRTR